MHRGRRPQQVQATRSLGVGTATIHDETRRTDSFYERRPHWRDFDVLGLRARYFTTGSSDNVTRAATATTKYAATTAAGRRVPRILPRRMSSRPPPFFCPPPPAGIHELYYFLPPPTTATPLGYKPRSPRPTLPYRRVADPTPIHINTPGLYPSLGVVCFTRRRPTESKETPLWFIKHIFSYLRDTLVYLKRNATDILLNLPYLTPPPAVTSVDVSAGVTNKRSVRHPSPDPRPSAQNPCLIGLDV